MAGPLDLSLFLSVFGAKGGASQALEANAYTTQPLRLPLGPGREKARMHGESGTSQQ